MEIPITFVGESCSLTLCDFAFVIRSKRRKSFSLAIVDDREDLIKDFCLHRPEFINLMPCISWVHLEIVDNGNAVCKISVCCIVAITLNCQALPS